MLGSVQSDSNLPEIFFASFFFVVFVFFFFFFFLSRCRENVSLCSFNHSKKSKRTVCFGRELVNASSVFEASDMDVHSISVLSISM